MRALWAYFAEQSFNEIHVEAGATLNAALLEAGLVDELLMYFAPRVVGAGLPAANFAPSVQLDDLQQAGQWRWLDVLTLDDDVRLRLRKIEVLCCGVWFALKSAGGVMDPTPCVLMRPSSMSTADDVYHGARWSVVHAPEPE